MPKVKIAFLGTGGFMGVHAQRLRAHPDAQVVALCDVSQEQTKKFELAHFSDYRPSLQLFTDPGKMYAEAKPDAVIK